MESRETGKRGQEGFIHLDVVGIARLGELDLQEVVQLPAAGQQIDQQQAEDHGLGVGDVEVHERRVVMAEVGTQARLQVRQVRVEAAEPVGHGEEVPLGDAADRHDLGGPLERGATHRGQCRPLVDRQRLDVTPQVPVQRESHIP